MKCDICGKDKNCQTWDYIIKRKGTGKVRQYTSGTDTVYKVGGKEVGRERNTTYTTGKVARVIDRGTAGICIKCRIIWSVVIVAVLSTAVSLILSLLLTPKDDALINYFSEFMMYFVPVFALIALTPLVKHIILSFKIAFNKKVLPWKVVSKFWE